MNSNSPIDRMKFLGTNFHCVKIPGNRNMSETPQVMPSITIKESKTLKSFSDIIKTTSEFSSFNQYQATASSKISSVEKHSRLSLNQIKLKMRPQTVYLFLFQSFNTGEVETAVLINCLPSYIETKKSVERSRAHCVRRKRTELF